MHSGKGKEKPREVESTLRENAKRKRKASVKTLRKEEAEVEEEEDGSSSDDGSLSIDKNLEDEAVDEVNRKKSKEKKRQGKASVGVALGVGGREGAVGDLSRFILAPKRTSNHKRSLDE